jgi:glycosyltransferase involved in cell wall biosynthesis
MKTLSIVIPVYNEEKRLNKTFKALSGGFNFNEIQLERVIFIDDGSTDNTVEKIRRQKEELENKLGARVDVYSYLSNNGKGYAIKTGMLISDSDYTLFFDADISTPLTEFKKFLPFIKESTPIIIGTRKNGESTVIIPQSLYRQMLGRGFTYLSNLILNTWVTDFTCGFKVFSREARNAIFSQSVINGWGFDAEALFLAKKFGFGVVERAVIWQDDKQSKVNLLKDLPQSLLELFKTRIYHSSLNNIIPRKPVLTTQVY